MSATEEVILHIDNSEPLYNVAMDLARRGSEMKMWRDAFAGIFPGRVGWMKVRRHFRAGLVEWIDAKRSKLLREEQYAAYHVYVSMTIGWTATDKSPSKYDEKVVQYLLDNGYCETGKLGKIRARC